jgi:hypothetical protein
MNFGSHHVATLWRLTKAGVTSQGVVMDSPYGPRLIVIEEDRIVYWERFRLAADLRAHASAMLRARRRAGWLTPADRES